MESKVHNSIFQNNLSQRIRRLIKTIPFGFIMSYGTIATCAGSPRASRVVVQELRRNRYELPWHRVINRFGEISIIHPEHTAEEQAALLRAEGHKVILTTEGIYKVLEPKWWNFYLEG
jgi:methylated-DNA-protein-cysteine methyltransferase-like protein